jgi:hypothetical protein
MSLTIGPGVTINAGVTLNGGPTGGGGNTIISGAFGVQNPAYGAIFTAQEPQSWGGAAPFVTGAVITITDSSFGNGTVVIELTSDLVYDAVTYEAWVANYNLISGSIAGAGFPATEVSIAGGG